MAQRSELNTDQLEVLNSLAVEMAAYTAAWEDLRGLQADYRYTLFHDNSPQRSINIDALLSMINERAAELGVWPIQEAA